MAKPPLKQNPQAGALRKPWEAESTAATEASNLVTEIDRWIGTKLLLRRKERGITRQTMATKMRTHVSSIRRWEDGVTSLSPAIIWQLTQILAVDPAFFFDGFGDE